MFFKRVKF